MNANRTFLLMGSGEFEPWSAEVEDVALNGRPRSVAILPTASAPEGDVVFYRWANMGLDHYRAMGVEARVVPLKRREEAERDDVAAELEGVGMAFFSGGNPRYLADTIQGTRFGDALSRALDAGTVFAGCSAGAMVAGRLQSMPPRFGSMWAAGLGLVPGGSFGAHWDRMRFIPGMRSFVMTRSKEGWFAGLDERTAILGDGNEMARVRPRWRDAPHGRRDGAVPSGGVVLDAELNRGCHVPARLSCVVVSSTGNRLAPEHQPTCFLCGRPTYDPDKRERPWVRATSRGRQVLVCPSCQEDRPDWAVQLDRCESCGATRLSAMLGQVVCRACGHVRGEPVEHAWISGA
jgi:cyanophycinase